MMACWPQTKVWGGCKSRQEAPSLTEDMQSPRFVCIVLCIVQEPASKLAKDIVKAHRRSWLVQTQLMQRGNH